MNGAQAITYLSEVKPYKSTWRVQVKILHTWKQYTAQSGETFEMVLSDQTGTKMHASVKKSLVAKYERHLVQGSWRVIENFSLAQVRGQYRLTNHLFKMGFVNNTFVTQSTPLSDDVYLGLVEFPNIIVGELNPFILIDVVGQIVNVGAIENVEAHNKPAKKLEFELRNTEDVRLPCTLWGKFAEQVYKACQNAGGDIVICLIRFAKVSTFRGENQITNAFDASLVEINPTYPEVQSFRQSLPTDGLGLTISITKPKLEMVVKSDAYFSQYPKKTIACLADLTEVQKCKIICTVCAIDADMGWFYVGCKKCSKKVELSVRKENSFLSKQKKPTYWCPKCSLNITQVVPRFKLHVSVMDQTAETKCLFFDSSAVEIVGQTAMDLLQGDYDDDLQSPENLPLAIRNLVGKTFQLLFCVENDNITGGNETYRIGKMWSGTDIDALDDHEDSDPVANPSQIISGDQEIYLLTNGPSDDDLTRTDVVTPSSTPSSKRGPDSAAVEMTSTTKKVCLKTVMIEKGVEKKPIYFEADDSAVDAKD